MTKEEICAKAEASVATVDVQRVLDGAAAPYASSDALAALGLSLRLGTALSEARHGGEALNHALAFLRESLPDDLYLASLDLLIRHHGLDSHRFSRTFMEPLYDFMKARETTAAIDELPRFCAHGETVTVRSVAAGPECLI